MLRLFYKLILLGLGVFVMIVGLSTFNIQRIHCSNIQYNQMPYAITLANTGNSHGLHAFAYTAYKDAAFNFALESQSLEYDNKLLDYYIDHFGDDSVLLIPISYVSFWGDELKDDSFDAKNARYLSILDADHMRFKSKNDYYISKLFSAVQIADRQIQSIFVVMDDIEKNPQKTDYTIEEVGEKRAAYHLRNIQNGTQLAEMNPDAIEAVLHMIKLCKEHNITPVLITTPYMSHYSKWFSNEFFKEFYGVIKTIQNDNDVIYLDYSRDERFNNTEGLFEDTDHLNKQGAKVFTEIIIQDLRSLGLLKE